jgi:hypothetical protein
MRDTRDSVLAGMPRYARLRWGCRRDAARSVSLGSNAGAFDTPYTTTNTTIPAKGHQILCADFVHKTLQALLSSRVQNQHAHACWCSHIYLSKKTARVLNKNNNRKPGLIFYHLCLRFGESCRANLEKANFRQTIPCPRE